MAENKKLIGEKILNYRIESLIGKGGMGSVYLAANMDFDQKVAIKVLHANMTESEFARQKFIKEAQTLLKLDHPNIVKFLNFHKNEDGIFLIMEYVDGITLDDFINTKNGLIVEAKAYGLFNQILDAFAYAHKQGIVHRDIKPANIILTHDNEGNFVIKVLDFGIARIISESNEEERGMIIGTPLYMSPEQVRGEPVDMCSDIYSLGVLLHQMLTGRAPYDSTTLSESEIQQKVVEEPLPRMKEYYQYISDRMQKVVNRATAKNPAARYPNCASFRKEFLPKPPTPLWQKIAAVLIPVLLLGGGWWYYSYNHITKTYYYKDYVEQWGVPVGIGKADYRKREGSYRFEKQKGKIIRVLHVNSRGNIIEHSDSEHTERLVNARFHYTAEGKVNYVEIMDRNDKILYKKTYDNNLRTLIFKHGDEFGAEMSLAASTTKLFASAFSNSEEEKSKISRFLLTYDENGYVERLQYAGFQNILFSDNDGLFGKAYIVDEKGRIIEELFLGQDGNPKANKAGLAIKVFEYDSNDHWTKVTYYDADRNLSSDGNGCPIVVLDNDRFGNRMKETYFDSDGNLTLRTDIRVAGFSYERNSEGFRIGQSVFGVDNEPGYFGNYGYSFMELEYDENGYPSKQSFKDMDGNLAVWAGFAIRTIKNDPRGNELEIQFLDVNHQPCESNEGNAKAIHEYDQLGNLISMFFYDSKDSLCLLSNGIAGQRITYTDKNRIESWTNYDTHDQPCADNEGIITCKYEYDPQGNRTKRSFYAADGITLSLSNEGIAGWRSKFNDYGSETERIFFDTDGNPTHGNLGRAGWRATYSPAGFMDELKNLDKNDQLVYVVSDGYAGIRYKYDNRGNITERYPYGTNGSLTGYITSYQYDSRDNQIETAYYSQNGQKTLGPDGYFRIEYGYNSRNQEIEERYYDASNRLFAPKSDNYAIIRSAYDNKGNLIEIAFYDASGERVCKKEGYATHKSEYDIMGRIIRQTFYDEYEQPTKPPVIPEGLVKYDKWGNMIYLAYADGHGNLIDNLQTGYAVKRWVFDMRGRLLETSVYDRNEGPCIDKSENVYKKTYSHDARGNETECRYYGIDSSLRKSNFAILYKKYDGQGHETEATYFDYQDKPVDAYGIVHKIVYNYDAQGNYDYLNCYRANGTLYGQQKYNPVKEEWEWMETRSSETDNTGWRQAIRDLSENCPVQLENNAEIQSITLNNNGFRMVIRYMDASKYSLSDMQVDEYKNTGRSYIQYCKQELNMPGSTRITVVGVDRVNRELFSITN